LDGGSDIALSCLSCANLRGVDETQQIDVYEEEAVKYNLQPVALGLFGGVYDFNRWPSWAGKAKPMAKQQLDEAGFKEAKPGVYDTRDWNAICNWAKELAQKVRSSADFEK